MNINISLIEKKAKRLFLSHRKTSYTIGLFFICCCLYVDFVTISNTCHKIDNLEYKEGVVSYWDHTGGEFNDATLKINNDTNMYYCCPIKPLYTAISSLNPAEIGMISSYFKFQAPLE